MNPSHTLQELIHELEKSLALLSGFVDSDLDEVLRPVILRRRRAVSALRAMLRDQPGRHAIPQAEDPPSQYLSLEDICSAEGDLLNQYDAAMADISSTDTCLAILSEQRAETEQAYLFLHARLNKSVSGGSGRSGRPISYGR